ncbi:MAG: outer membrane lipoprotein carrier protein LolA [Desulfobacterales bacterium]|nr:outer membrane lipoprotein carrier protein LolA [Desulfobacterales bacterium]
MLKSNEFKLFQGLLACLCVLVVGCGGAFAQASAPKLEDIVAGIEKRYSGSGFFARFNQTSTLKEMGISDSASGKIYVKHPGMMLWEYEKPDRQVFVTDSRTLWVYRPEDNQVMVGEAPVYFGSGKGASFLSDMKQLREKFIILRHEQADTDRLYVLTLTPKIQKVDVSVIYLSISKTMYDIVQIVTLNSYGDETRIAFSDLRFNQGYDDKFFKFTIPDGMDVLKLD